MYLLREGLMSGLPILLPGGPPLSSSSISLSFIDLGWVVKDWFASRMDGERMDIPDAMAAGVEDIASFRIAVIRSIWAWFRGRFGDGEVGRMSRDSSRKVGREMGCRIIPVFPVWSMLLLYVVGVLLSAAPWLVLVGWFSPMGSLGTLLPYYCFLAGVLQ